MIRHRDLLKKGFSLLEILLAVGIFSLASITVGYLIIDSTISTDINTKKIAEILYAREGLEAVRSVRDTIGFAGLPTGQYGLQFNGNDWTLVSGADQLEGGIYSRVIEIGPLQSNTQTKVATSTVWAQSYGRTTRVDLVTILSGWR